MGKSKQKYNICSLCGKKKQEQSKRCFSCFKKKRARLRKPSKLKLLIGKKKIMCMECKLKFWLDEGGYIGGKFYCDSDRKEKKNIHRREHGFRVIGANSCIKCGSNVDKNGNVWHLCKRCLRKKKKR